jgi:hypothetical protein
MRQFNSMKGRSVLLGCWVRQTHVPKHIWTCYNMRLHELQIKWVIRSKAAEVVVCVHCILGLLECGRRNPSLWPRGTLYPQKLALTSPTSGGSSIGIVLKATTAASIQVSKFSFQKAMPGIKLSHLWHQTRYRRFNEQSAVFVPYEGKPSELKF